MPIYSHEKRVLPSKQTVLLSMSGFLDWQSQCPYCGEIITLYIDPENNDSRTIEDCSVCCRPINVYVAVNYEGGAYRIESVQLGAEDE